MNLRKKKSKSETSPKKDAPVYGCLPGLEVGQIWATRQELSDSWVHRPKAANFHAGPGGIYSVLINSRYRGVDSGFTVVYSGHKVKDNGSVYDDNFVKNWTLKNPIRVIRCAKKNSAFAPAYGFRFDGLYNVENYWIDKEQMYFSLRRIPTQSVPPWIRTVPRTPFRGFDEQISPYTSYIRYQSRVRPNVVSKLKFENRTKEEEDVVEEVEQEVIELEDEDLERVGSENNEETSYSPEISTPENLNVAEQPLPVSPQIPSVSDVVNDQESFIDPQPSPPEPKHSVCDLDNISGVPMPMKEEGGQVILETVPLPSQSTRIDEVIETAEVYSEESLPPDEEIEIDSKFIENIGEIHILTADPVTTQSQRLELLTSDIDIEEGPKFSEIFVQHSSLITDNSLAVPSEAGSISIVKKQENISTPIIKNDSPVYEDYMNNRIELNPTEITDQFQIEDKTEVTEDSNCLYIYPATKCENVTEAEQAILSGNFHWYQGSRPCEIETKSPTPYYSIPEYQENVLVVDPPSPEGATIIDEIQEDSVLPPSNNILLHHKPLSEGTTIIDEIQEDSVLPSSNNILLHHKPLSEGTTIIDEVQEDSVLPQSNNILLRHKPLSEGTTIIDEIQEHSVLPQSNNINNTNDKLIKCQDLILAPRQNPDSTSQMVVSNKCQSGRPGCPYSDIKLGELVSYTINKTFNGCVCTWEDNLPCMKYCVEEILRAREARGHASALKGIGGKKILAPPPLSLIESKLGTIIQMQPPTSSSYSAELKTEDQKDNYRCSVHTDSYQNKIEVINVDEVEDASNSDVEVEKDPLDFSVALRSRPIPLSNAEVFWKGLEEVRNEAARQTYKTEDSVSLSEDSLESSSVEDDDENDESYNPKGTKRCKKHSRQRRKTKRSKLKIERQDVKKPAQSTEGNNSQRRKRKK